MRAEDSPPTSWIGATWRALVIVAYFVLATVWLPDFVIHLRAVAESSSAVRDLVVSVVWGGALAAGMYALRLGQKRGLI